MNAKDFIKKYGPTIVIATEGSNIFPSVAIAQAALESGWGESGLTKTGKALFGIKANDAKSPYWHGKVYTSGTVEYVNGERVNITSGFRSYDSVGDSVRDYVHFLQSNKRYENNGVFTATTPEDQAAALKRAGYATDPNYTQKIISIINQYNLKDFDSKKKIMKWIEISLAAVSIALAGWTLYKNLK